MKTLSGTRSAAIGSVVRSHLRDVVVTRCNLLQNGEITTVRVEFLVEALGCGFLMFDNYHFYFFHFLLGHKVSLQVNFSCIS